MTYTFPNTTDSGGFDWDNIKDNFENDVLIEEDKKIYILQVTNFKFVISL